MPSLSRSWVCLIEGIGISYIPIPSIHSELEWNFCVGFCGRGYKSHIWFLHTTGLLRYQGPQKKYKRPRKFSKALAKATDTFYRNLMTFLANLDRFDIRIQPIEVI